MTDEKGADGKRQPEIEIKGALWSVRLPAEVDIQSPQTLAELRTKLFKDLLSIAAAPTGLLAEMLRGLQRTVRVMTFGGGSKRTLASAKKGRKSRAEALQDFQRILEKHNAVVVEGPSGTPAIVVISQSEEHLLSGKSPGPSLVDLGDLVTFPNPQKPDPEDTNNPP